MISFPMVGATENAEFAHSSQRNISQIGDGITLQAPREIAELVAKKFRESRWAAWRESTNGKLAEEQRPDSASAPPFHRDSCLPSRTGSTRAHLLLTYSGHLIG